METMMTILWQVATMFLLAAVGYVMYKTKKISADGSKTLGNVLIYLSLPCVIINGFLVDRTPQKVTGLLISTIAAIVVLVVSAVISRIFLGRHAIDNFAAAFSNAGFFGIPLISGALGADGVFYLVPFIAFLNLFQWTYGVALLEASDETGIIRKKNAKSTENPGLHNSNFDLGAFLLRVIKAPYMIAIVIGLIFFLSGIKMPSIIEKGVQSIANVNTPIAMFTIGIYMAQTDVKKMFLKPRLYYLSFVRMIIIPVVTLLMLCALPSSMNDMKLAVLIASACPVGSNVAVYAQLYDKDYAYAVETVVISTLFSIIAIPLIVGAAGVVF